MMEAEVIIEIPFYDVDSLNIVWHGNYIKYLEDARCALFSKINYTYDIMGQTGYAWPIVTMKIKYIAPGKFMQKIKVKAILVEYEHRIKMKYIITDASSGSILSKAETVQIGVNLQTMESCFSSPPVLIEKIENYLRSKHDS